MQVKYLVLQMEIEQFQMMIGVTLDPIALLFCLHLKDSTDFSLFLLPSY